MRKSLLLLFTIFCYSAANSQSLQLFNIDTTNFPVMKAKFFAFGADGKQLKDFSPSDFEISEDGVQRKVLRVNCPLLEEPKSISSVLTIDVSGSMTGKGLANAQAAAVSWINGLQSGKSECAVTSFSNNSNIVQDFTTNKSKLLQSISKLTTSGGTDYNEAYMQSIVGGLEVAKRGKFKRILVFLTDGEPNEEPKTQKIIDLANQHGVSVYCITLNIHMPDCLRDISAKTGGAVLCKHNLRI